MHEFPEVSSEVAFENISYKASELNVINVLEFTLQMNIISFYISSALFQFFALVHPTFWRMTSACQLKDPVFEKKW